MKRRIVLVIGLIGMVFFSNAQEVSVVGNKFFVGENQIWFNGINTPWHKFCDFGKSDFDYAWWTAEFEKYPDSKINLARVWIHMSGEQSPNISDDGFVTGVSDDFWDHMDHLFQLANDNEVYVLPALFSFDITKNQYSTHEKWRAFIQDPDKIQSYIDEVLIPMMERYENEPYLLAWEICNEPEWMFENEESGPQSWQDIQVFHAMMAAAVHENSAKMVTTGSAAPKWNSPRFDSWGDAAGNLYSDEALSTSINNTNAYLDFYQYHWYAWQTEYLGSPFTNTTKYYQVDDKPVLVGESEGNDVCDDFVCQTVSEMYESAFTNGFDGVCAWKTPQDDGHGTFENIAVATLSFYTNHSELIYPLLLEVNSLNVSALVSVYPNPVNDDSMYLDFSDSASVHFVEISSSNGMLIKQIEIVGKGKHLIDIEGVSPGVYLISIKSVSQNITKKIVVQ